MAAKCKKCDPHEICEECPEWIFTLADLIMCMMGLFVLLWVLKPTGVPETPAAAAEMAKQEKRQDDVLSAIRKEFNSGLDTQISNTDPTDSEQAPKVPRRVGEGDKGTQQRKEEAAEGTDPKVQTIRPGETSPVGTRVDFERGDVTLEADDQRRLNDIAREITGTRFVVIIKGHAAKDDFADGTPGASFMDISLKRAQASADYLVSRGVSPDVLRVQGCSTFEPVRERAYGAELQKKNRRVEVFVTNVVVADMQDPERVTAAPLD